MKLIVSIPVPPEKERDIKIADQIDHDPETILRYVLEFMREPTSNIMVHVEYPPVKR